jgi:hypothetical protein
MPLKSFLDTPSGPRTLLLSLVLKGIQDNLPYIISAYKRDS